MWLLCEFIKHIKSKKSEYTTHKHKIKDSKFIHRWSYVLDFED